MPLIIFPFAIFERRFNAERVQSIGGGFWGELSDFNYVWLKNKIDSIKGLKENVSKIRDTFKKYEGGANSI